jgi:hypothetical protein
VAIDAVDKIQKSLAQAMYLTYISLMPREQTQNTISASPAYAALRHGGWPAHVAAVQLQLDPLRAVRLERLFQARRGGGQDAMKPAYARNGRHVADVLAQGGYPALPEKKR